MIFIAGLGTFATAFTALYCAAVCNEKWFRILVTSVVSFVISVLVASNLYY